jgi:hypothetical protein
MVHLVMARWEVVSWARVARGGELEDPDVTRTIPMAAIKTTPATPAIIQLRRLCV